MTALPPSLVPWRAHLDALHPEVAAAVGPCLPRLAAALGPLHVPIVDGEGEPDGVDGLTRRGPWSRLLPSAWALAEAHPDEFLRRAAEGELAFLRQARRAPHGGWRGLAWLDVGPEIVGAPRLLGLAACLVLGRRVAAAGGEALAVWMSADGVRRVPMHDLDGLRGWLGTRTRRVPSRVDAERLRASLELSGRDRVWSIGGPRLGGVARDEGWGAIEVVEALDDEVLEVRVDGSTPAVPPLRLPLPDEAAIARVLRDPRAPAPEPAARRLEGVHLVDSVEDDTLFLVAGSRLVRVERAGPEPRVRVHALPGPVVAVGLLDDRPVALVRQGPVLGVAWPEGVPPGAWRGAPTSVLVDAEMALSEPVRFDVLPAILHGADGESVPRAAGLLRDAAGVWWVVDVLNGRAEPVMRDVSPCIGLQGGRSRLFLHRTRRDQVLQLREWTPEPPDEAVGTLPFTGPALDAGPVPALRDQSWGVVGTVPDAVERLLPCIDGRAAGLAGGLGAEARPLWTLTLSREDALVVDDVLAGGVEGAGLALTDDGALVLAPDRRTVERQTAFTREVVHRLDAPLLRHRVALSGRVLLGLDARGRAVFLGTQDAELHEVIDLPPDLR